jgi:hypothetical protein
MNIEQTILDLLHADSLTTSSLAGDCRRKEPRIPQEPSLVRIATDEGEFIPVIAQIANLSRSGIGLRTSKPVLLSPGTPLVIEVGSLLISGIVRYCARSRVGSGPYDLGLEVESVRRIQ